MKNQVYDMMINNSVNYLNKLTVEEKLQPDCINAFRISEVLSIALAKDKNEIIQDIIKLSKEKKYK